MKVILEIPEKNLKWLEDDAKDYGRSRKKHMEILLIELSTPRPKVIISKTIPPQKMSSKPKK